MGCSQSSELREFETFTAELHKRDLKKSIDILKEIHNIQKYMERIESSFEIKPGHFSSYNSLHVRQIK